MTIPFKRLESGPDPVAGLFFIDPESLTTDDDLSAGMAFLIAEDGLIATCAHVMVAIDRVPGEIVVLRAVSPSLPIEVQAEVLAEGWRGPNWEEWIERPDRLERNWLTECDARPDVFRQDFALLRIRSGSARWDTRRGAVSEGSAEECLRSGARVLPVSAPGYAHTARPRFMQWRVSYELGAPRIETAYSEFQGLDPSLYDVIQVRSADIGKAYSGGPIWDPERQRVVGMLRRWLRHADVNALGVDGRAIAMLAGIDLSLDDHALRFIDLASSTVDAIAPLRHFPLLESFVPRKLLRLRLRAATERDALDEEAPKPAVDALQALRGCVAQNTYNTTIVRGGAGAGKSMLLRQFAKDLLLQPMGVAGKLAVPFPVMASELRSRGYDVSSLIAEACKSFSMRFTGPALEMRCIPENDLCVVLLVDGVDEIEPKERSRLLSSLKAFAQSHSAYRVVATTRPIEDRDLSIDPRGLNAIILELVALENDDVEQFVRDLFADEDVRLRFRHALAEIEWDRSGPLPLQLAMAVKCFEMNHVLGGRPLDFQFELARHLVQIGKAEDAKLDTGRDASELATRAPYLVQLDRILQRVALAYLDGYTTRDEVAKAIAADSRFQFDINGLERVMEFLEQEPILRGGLLHFEDREGIGNRTLCWPHRTVPETLAAQHIAWLKCQHRVSVGPDIERLWRAHGQSLGVVILGALDRHEVGSLSVDRYLAQCLDRGRSEFKSTMLAMRALAANIRVGEFVRKRLVKTMVALLLLSPKQRLGRVLCAEVFSMEDVPDMADLANRPGIRPLVIEQLRDRWLRRTRNTDVPVTLTAREQKLLDRLGLWHEIGLKFAAPERAGRVFIRTSPISPAAAVQQDLLDSGAAALLLGEILAHLRDRAEDFMSGFAEFVRSAPPDADPVSLAHAYLKSLELRVH